MRADVYYDDLGKDMRVEELPEDMREKAEQYREELLEHLSECDEAFMEKYLAEMCIRDRSRTTPCSSTAPRPSTAWASRRSSRSSSRAARSSSTRSSAPPITPTSVSYTHLDVYKRQEQSLW